jgi:hypothetical protein
MEVGAGVSRCPVLPEKCCHARRPSSRYFYASKDGSLTSPYSDPAQTVTKAKKAKTAESVKHLQTNERRLKCTLSYFGEAGNGTRTWRLAREFLDAPCCRRSVATLVGRRVDIFMLQKTDL